MIDEKGLEAAALEFRRHHRNCCYPEALGGEATRAVQAIITAYLSARSAEPVAWMSEWKPIGINNAWQAHISFKDPRINGLREYRKVQPLYTHPKEAPDV